MADIELKAEARERTLKVNPWQTRALNSLLVILSSSSLLAGLIAITEKEFEKARIPLATSVVAALIADYVNQSTKSAIALFKMAEEGKNRLAAREIQSKEVTTAADIGVIESRKLTELDLDEAVTQSEASIYLAELEARHEDEIARLQEFDVN